MVFYLDSVNHDSGALRVIPGSHMVGDRYGDALEGIVGNSMDNMGVENNEMPAQVLETVPGDLVVFNQNIKHASFGGSRRRRMFAMGFCPRWPEDKLTQFREELGKEARFLIDRIHGEEMIRTAGPERWVHLEQVRENDVHLAELTKELRKAKRAPARG